MVVAFNTPIIAKGDGKYNDTCGKACVFTFPIANSDTYTGKYQPGDEAAASQPILDEKYSFITTRKNMFFPPAKDPNSDPPCVSPGFNGGAEWGPAAYDEVGKRIYVIDNEDPMRFFENGTPHVDELHCTLLTGYDGKPVAPHSYIRAIDGQSNVVTASSAGSKDAARPSSPGLDMWINYLGGLLSTSNVVVVGTREGTLRAYSDDLKQYREFCVDNYVNKLQPC